jgi:uncharacterized membrane protein YczE
MTSRNPTVSPPLRSHQPAIDRVGAAASFLCALHCALLPVGLALVPALAGSLIAERGFEVGFVLFATTLAAITVVLGWRRHHIVSALWFLVPGVLLLWLGAFTELHETEPLHTILVTIGGTLVAVGHIVNLRLGHGHVHDATCRH